MLNFKFLLHNSIIYHIFDKNKNDIVMKKWNEMSDLAVKRFISYHQDEVIYIINTGFQDKWMVIYEDAYEMSLGKTFIGTKIEVEQKYNINF